jgi:hypothetical protein
MKNTTKNNGVGDNIKYFRIAKSRHLNFRDLLNEWNTTPAKPN